MNGGNNHGRPIRNLEPGDIRAFFRVIREFKERENLELLFGYIAQAIEQEPLDPRILAKVDMVISIADRSGKCAIQTEKGNIGEFPGGLLVIDNQTGDTVCFTPDDVGVFDQTTTSSGVDFLADGQVCLPPGKSILPIADDAPDGSYDLDFKCTGNGGGPRLIIPPPKTN